MPANLQRSPLYLRRWLMLGVALSLLASRRGQAFTVAAQKSATDTLSALSKVTLRCSNGETLPYKSTKGPYALNDTCDLYASWSAVATAEDVTYSPGSLVIRTPGSPDAAFSVPLSVVPQQMTIISGTWYTSDRFKTGTVYDIYVLYKFTAGAAPTTPGGTSAPPPVLSDYPVKVFSFRPVKSHWAGQFTGKVFTAWQLSSAGDQSYIVPGLAGGIAYRYASDFNDQDVVALRGVVAAGPNLVSKSTVTTDSTGKVTGIQNSQQFQILLGAEFVVGRFISFGAAWPLLSHSGQSDSPLLLVTYGELYPAASTK